MVALPVYAITVTVCFWAGNTIIILDMIGHQLVDSQLVHADQDLL